MRIVFAAILINHAKSPETVLSRIPVSRLPAGARLAVAGGASSSWRKFTLSLADAFVAALAQIHDARIVTGDPEFKPLEEAREIRVLWLPEKPKTGRR